MSERKTLEQLADEAFKLSKYHGLLIHHVKSGAEYRIIETYFRESDMAPSVIYTPIGDFYSRVKFGRTIEEMDFGNRFLFEGGPSA